LTRNCLLENKWVSRPANRDGILRINVISDKSCDGAFDQTSKYPGQSRWSGRRCLGRAATTIKRGGARQFYTVADGVFGPVNGRGDRVKKSSGNGW